MGTGVSPSPSHRIVTQIAATEGVAPAELRPPLHDVVDPDALERLVESSGDDVSITFTYRGHRVRVDGDGTVDVTAASKLTDAGNESPEESHGD